MLEKGDVIRKGKYSPSSLAIAWVCGELLALKYGVTKQHIQSEFTRRSLRLSNLEHVLFYISTRPRGK